MMVVLQATVSTPNKHSHISQPAQLGDPADSGVEDGREELVGLR